MLKVFFIDDETIARLNLRYLIDWGNENCVICGEADNSLDALKKVKELKPDVVFTDMKMASMNGVELIKDLRKIAPSVRVVVISAFDDFEFVRQSLKEGAFDYLVKHKLDGASLKSILNSLKEDIKKESIEKQKTNKILELASSGKTFIQKNIILNMINGHIQENFHEVLKKYDISLDDRNIIIAVSRIDDYYLLKEKFSAQEFSTFMETLENIISNICKELGKIVFLNTQDGEFVFIMSFAENSREAQINSSSKSYINNIENSVKRFLNVKMSFGISDICYSIAKLSEYYNEARTVLGNGYYKGSNYIIQKNELITGDVYYNQAGLSVNDEKNIIANIRSLNKKEVIKIIEDILNNIKEKKVSFETVKIVSIDLINLLKRMIKETGIVSALVYPKTTNLYEEIKKFRTIEELLIWFADLFSSLIDVLEGNSIDNRHTPVIKKAIEYILNNYQKDISLSDVSSFVNVSPQYLSKLFKEECGVGYVNYLNNLRIEQAKRMLTEGIEIKNLFQKTGFNNYTYFFTVFKEITGMTPQQYEKVQKNQIKYLQDNQKSTGNIVGWYYES